MSPPCARAWPIRRRPKARSPSTTCRASVEAWNLTKGTAATGDMAERLSTATSHPTADAGRDFGLPGDRTVIRGVHA